MKASRLGEVVGNAMTSLAFNIVVQAPQTYIDIPPKSPFKFATLLFVASARQNKSTYSALALIATLAKGDLSLRSIKLWHFVIQYYSMPFSE